MRWLVVQFGELENTNKQNLYPLQVLELLSGWILTPELSMVNDATAREAASRRLIVGGQTPPASPKKKALRRLAAPNSTPSPVQWAEIRSRQRASSTSSSSQQARSATPLKTKNLGRSVLKDVLAEGGLGVHSSR